MRLVLLYTLCWFFILLKNFLRNPNRLNYYLLRIIYPFSMKRTYYARTLSGLLKRKMMDLPIYFHWLTLISERSYRTTKLIRMENLVVFLNYYSYWIFQSMLTL